MRRIQDIDDWVQGIIVLIVLVGSALSGLGKVIANKLNKRQSVEPSSDGGEGRQLRPKRREIVIPPVARPLPPPPVPRPRVVVRTQTKTATLSPQPGAPGPAQRAEREMEVSVPEMIRPLVEMLLEKAGPQDEESRPAPPPPPRVQRPRPQHPRPQRARPVERSAPAITERAARLRDIEEREARQAKRVERRIGHVETHVASAPDVESPQPALMLVGLDRRSLRRAVVLNEILGPPVALRTQDGDCRTL